MRSPGCHSRLGALLALLLGACAAHLPPLDAMSPGPRLEQRRAYLEQHPDLGRTQFDAIYHGLLARGLTPEQVTLVRGAPDSKSHLQGLFDEVWTWATPRDTTWVFFNSSIANAVDGTTPLYRFPRVDRDEVVFRFVLPRGQSVAVGVYDDKMKLRGRLFRATMEAGAHELVLKLRAPKNDSLPLRPAKTLRAGRVELKWNGLDEKEHELPAGLYYLRLSSVDRNELRRFQLIR